MSEILAMDARAAWVERVLGVRVPPRAPKLEPVPESVARAEQARREIAAGLGGLSMAFRKARLSWGAARTAAREQVRKLRDGLRAELRDDPEFPAMDQAIAGLDDVLQGLDERLDDALDAAMNAKDRAAQTEQKLLVLRLIGEYRAYVDGNDVLRRIDSNPYMPLPVHALLSGELETLAEELS